MRRLLIALLIVGCARHAAPPPNDGVFRVAIGRFVIDAKVFDYRPQSSAAGNRVRLNLKPVVISAGVRWRL